MRFFVTTINNTTPVQNASPADSGWAGLGVVVEAATPEEAVAAYAVNHGPLSASRAVRVIEADHAVYYPVAIQPVVGVAQTYVAPAVG